MIKKSEEQIRVIDRACKIVNEVLYKLEKMAKPGVSTILLDREAVKICKERGGIPAFLGYANYPASICISINDEVVHGIPREEKVLKEGDIVSLDFGVKLDGFYGDGAVTFGIGKISYNAQRLIENAKECLRRAIEFCEVGKKLGQVSYAIQSCAEGEGFSVVRDYVGHGIGLNLHEPPQIPNYGFPEDGPILEEGMVLALEPMVCEGDWKVIVDEDGWTVRTKDGKNSAHFECCVAITKEGPKILGNLAI